MKKLLTAALFTFIVSSVIFAGAIAEKPGLKEEVKPTLKALIGYVNFDPNVEYSAKASEELTGYKVEYSSLPSTDESSKLNAILAAREKYDVISVSYSLFSQTVGLGAYRSLDDLLDEYGQSILAGTNDALWTNTTIDGQKMGIPFRLSNENYTSGRRVRTDLMKAAGLSKLPETPDELYVFLKTAKEKLGIIPMTGNGAIVDEIASAFGISNAWNITPDGIRNRVTTPGAKEYVEFMHKLYSEGLIDSEWAQNTASSMQEKFYSGKAMIYQLYWWNEPSATNTLLSNFPNAEFSYLPPLKDSEGNSGMPINRGTDQVIVIPKVASNAEDAVKWMDSKLSSEDVFRRLCIGIEGVHYNTIGENEYEPIQPAFANDLNYANVYLTGTITKDYGIYWAQTRVRKNETLYGEFLKMQENVEKSTIYYDPTTFMSPNSEFTALAPSVNTYVNDTIIQMIVGTRGIDEWDSFVREYYAIGGERLERILNDWWAENKSIVEPLSSR